MIVHIITSPAGPDDVIYPWLYVSSHVMEAQPLDMESRQYTSKRPAYNMLTHFHANC